MLYTRFRDMIGGLYKQVWHYTFLRRVRPRAYACYQVLASYDEVQAHDGID